MKKIEDDIVRWGIIGAGDVCEVKSAPAMQLVPESALVAVMRRQGDKAADFALRHQVPKWYDQAEDLIRDPDVNAVYIATPPDAHARLTELATQAGKPVYVEKPMARTVAECQRMISAGQRNQQPVYVAYYRRALPNFLKIKSLIDQGRIGQARAVHIHLTTSLGQDSEGAHQHNWRVDPTIAGGGYFYDLASHQLDFLDFVFGPITTAYGISSNQAKKYPAEDIVTGSFRFENDVVGSGLWCFTTAEVAQKEETTIIGSKGVITYQNFGNPQVLLHSDDQGEEVFDFVYPKHIQECLIKTVVDDLLGRGRCPSTAETAARTNWVMEQICHYDNRQI